MAASSHLRATQQESEHLMIFDGTRGIAILLIFWFHLYADMHGYWPGPCPWATPLPVTCATLCSMVAIAYILILRVERPLLLLQPTQLTQSLRNPFRNNLKRGS
jgi:hypothetical protein